MKRNAFLLGFYATGGQVLILRELVSSLNFSDGCSG
jgi:glutamate synthase domain-containing protein 3